MIQEIDHKVYRMFRNLRLGMRFIYAFCFDALIIVYQSPNDLHEALLFGLFEGCK